MTSVIYNRIVFGKTGLISTPAETVPGWRWELTDNGVACLSGPDGTKRFIADTWWYEGRLLRYKFRPEDPWLTYGDDPETFFDWAEKRLRWSLSDAAKLGRCAAVCGV